MKNLALTKQDAQWLAAIKVSVADPLPLRFDEQEMRHLVAQLQQDVRLSELALDAAEAELVAATVAHTALLAAYGRLNSECARALSRVREMEQGGWWTRLRMAMRVTV